MFLEKILSFFSRLLFFSGSIGGSSFPRPLGEKEEKECIAKMRAGDKSAREKLISHNLRLVAHVVKKYSGLMETDDLISVGSIGLIKAIDSFDEKKNTQLATFAARCIENEILMLLRANKKYKNDLSLTAGVGADKDGNELTLMDLLYEKEEDVFGKVDREIEKERFKKFLKNTLTDREYKVITLRYGLDGDSYCQREVAKFLHISRSYISRIEKHALEKLKESAKRKDFY